MLPGASPLAEPVTKSGRISRKRLMISSAVWATGFSRASGQIVLTKIPSTSPSPTRKGRIRRRSDLAVDEESCIFKARIASNSTLVHGLFP
jgi:hypothetical protein